MAVLWQISTNWSTICLVIFCLLFLWLLVTNSSIRASRKLLLEENGKWPRPPWLLLEALCLSTLLGSLSRCSTNCLVKMPCLIYMWLLTFWGGHMPSSIPSFTSFSTDSFARNSAECWRLAVNRTLFLRVLQLHHLPLSSVVLLHILHLLCKEKIQIIQQVCDFQKMSYLFISKLLTTVILIYPVRQLTQYACCFHRFHWLVTEFHVSIICCLATIRENKNLERGGGGSGMNLDLVLHANHFLHPSHF